MAPVIGSFFKMAVPFIVILPGLLGLVLLQNPDGSRRQLILRHGGLVDVQQVILQLSPSDAAGSRGQICTATTKYCR